MTTYYIELIENLSQEIDEIAEEVSEFGKYTAIYEAYKAQAFFYARQIGWA